MTDSAPQPPPPGHRRPRDEGTVMIITLMVMMLVATLATTVMRVTIDDLTNTRRAEDSAMALDAAEAGVTQAVAYLRSSGTRGLECSPSCGATNPWGSSAAPMAQDVSGTTAQRYATWISRPVPTGKPGARVATVTSEGRSGQGVRRIAVDVVISLSEARLPLGMFARTITGAGGATFTNVSAFTTGCVWGRRNLTMIGDDPAYGIKAAVHSARVITPANGSGTGCTASSGNGNNAPIHASGGCSTEFPFDQDSLGGPCPSVSSLYPTYYADREMDGNPANGPEVNGTFIRDAPSLRTLFDIDDDPIPAARLEQLKLVAKSQVDGSHSNYYTSTTGWSAPDPAKHPQSVLYFDLAATEPGGIVDLKDLGDTWKQPTSTVTSGCAQHSLLIIIAGGNLRMNSGNEVSASIVLTSKTYGEVNKGNGSPNFTGTIFANTLDLAGSINLKLDPCFLANLSPHLSSVEAGNYRELDRG